MRCPLVNAAVMMASVAMASRVEAQANTEGAPQESPAPEVVVRSESVWYGPTTAIVYGSAYAAGVPGYFLTTSEESRGVRIGGALLFAGGAITALIGVPVVHWTQGELERGLISFGAQLGSLAAGLGAGALVGSIADVDAGDATGYGALAGHAIWALVDVFVMSRKERILSVEMRTAFQPALIAVPGGATVNFMLANP